MGAEDILEGGAGGVGKKRGSSLPLAFNGLVITLKCHNAYQTKQKKSKADLTHFFQNSRLVSDVLLL